MLHDDRGFRTLIDAAEARSPPQLRLTDTFTAADPYPNTPVTSIVRTTYWFNNKVNLEAMWAALRADAPTVMDLLFSGTGAGCGAEALYQDIYGTSESCLAQWLLLWRRVVGGLLGIGIALLGIGVVCIAQVLDVKYTDTQCTGGCHTDNLGVSGRLCGWVCPGSLM